MEEDKYNWRWIAVVMLITGIVTNAASLHGRWIGWNGGVYDERQRAIASGVGNYVEKNGNVEFEYLKMRKKFTQKELEEAYQQMQTEREEEYKHAQDAADWIKKQPKCPKGAIYVRSILDSHLVAVPYPIYKLFFVYETYGPTKSDWDNWLKNQPLTNLDAGCLKIATPFGEFPVDFEYFDNHVGGF